MLPRYTAINGNFVQSILYIAASVMSLFLMLTITLIVLDVELMNFM